MKKIKKFLTKKGFKGFTLIELLVVIAIIAILSAIVITALGSSKDKANKAAAKRTAQSVMRQIEIAATEGGTINPPTSTTDGGGNICTSCSSTATWPSIAKTGYVYSGITAGTNAAGSFELKLTKADKPTIAVTFTNGSGVITEVAYVADPCGGKNVGDTCTNGVLYAGTGFSGLGSYKYMTTPSGCTDYVNNFTEFTPVCNGSADVVSHKWANNSGTTGNVNTGATSTTEGKNNTSILAINYTDTDAARYCENMIYPATNGYSDWYLPAKDEFNNILYSMYAAGKGNITVAGAYWSSTEGSSSTAWFNNPADNGRYPFAKTVGNLFIRCLRRY